VITYGLPDPEIARGIIESHLTGFDLKDLKWAAKFSRQFSGD